jgi:hypothetical protein
MRDKEAAKALAKVLAEYGDEMDISDALEGLTGDNPAKIANSLVRVIEWLDVDIYNMAVGGA